MKGKALKMSLYGRRLAFHIAQISLCYQYPASTSTVHGNRFKNISDPCLFAEVAVKCRMVNLIANGHCGVTRVIGLQRCGLN